jgi:hypothetical protein
MRTMHPTGRTGVRFVLTNPSDPSRLNEFRDWYDIYSAALRRACSTPPHDSGSSKDPPRPPNGSRYSRPTTQTLSTLTCERLARRRLHRRSTPN